MILSVMYVMYVMYDEEIMFLISVTIDFGVIEVFMLMLC